MNERRLSLAGKIDIGLVKGLGHLFAALKNAALWLAGLLSFIALPTMTFEYAEGLADISWHEMGATLLLGLLLWRHIRYCRFFDTGFWRGLSRLLMVQGVLSCTLLTFSGLTLGLLLNSRYLDGFLDYLRLDDPISKLTTYALVLFAVFVAAPTNKRPKAAAAPAQPLRIEPSVSAMAREAQP
ncbi:hypothetical protein ACOXVJ_15175 [Pseudomonas knackmussii]|uniref:hypothetical protein n=1 Tax=Pseudomonas knackmussii TaxID=65741 RepID=UPI003BD4951D